MAVPAPIHGPLPVADRALTLGRFSLYGLRARLVRAVGWNLVAAVFTQGSTLVLNLILANLWGLRAFGQFAIVQSTVTAFTSGAQAIVATTATRYVAELRTREPQRAGRVLGLCAAVAVGLAAVAAAILIGGAGPIATVVLHQPDLAGALAMVGLVVFFSIVFGVMAGGLAGLEGYAALGKAGIFSGITYVVLGAVGGWRWGLIGALTGLAASAGLQAAVLARALAREAASHHVRITVAGAWQEMAVLRRFLAPSAVNSLIAFPALWSASALLVRQADGYQQMALFTAANTLRVLILFVPAIVNNVTLSLLNNQRGADREGSYRRMFWVNMGLTCAMVAAGALGVVLLGPWLLGVFGRDFRAGYPVLLVLMLSTLPETVVGSAIQIAQSRERMWLWCGAVIVPCYGTLVGVAAVLTAPLGARGLAWSYVAGMSVAVVAAGLVVARLGIWGATAPAAGDARG